MRAPTLLFHGTDVDYDLPQTNDSDGVFWLTDCSRVAQHYIRPPRTISTTYIFADDLDKPVRPDTTSALYSVVLMMGHKAYNIVHDRNGNTIKFKRQRSYPTYRQVASYIEEELGYKPATVSPLSYHLLSGGWEPTLRREIITKADASTRGHLLIVTGLEPMKFSDLRHREHKSSHLSTLRFCERAMPGYQGVLVNDFCHSHTLGRVGHLSYGIFPHALPDLRIERVPASHFDWRQGESISGKTLEFAAWLADRHLKNCASDAAQQPELSLTELRRRSSNFVAAP